MNDSNNILSLGNLFNIIKKTANDKNTAYQSELFCSIFGINEINNTTVNNYCIGYRPIGIEYKKIYINLKEKYNKDYDVFIDIIISLLCILDEKIYVNKSLDIINSNKKLKIVCDKLFALAKSDKLVGNDFVKNINFLLSSNNLYETMIEFLCYVILDNIQPIYIQKINIKINKEELEEYLKIKLYEGISYINSLKLLSKKGNMYANAELGSLEFSGYVDGNKNYDKSYNYYYMSALKGHPKGCYMVANLIITEKVKKAFSIAWDYLNKAIKYGSSAAYNTMGNCYLKGIGSIKKDIFKALHYYKVASELGYAYAYNNLGMMEEKSNNMEKAFEYYKISADMGESWALNKLGEYYRSKKDLKTAYLYYLKSSMCSKEEKCYYSLYNIAVYYLLDGNNELNIKKNKNQAIKLLLEAEKNNIKEATIYLKKLNK